MLCGSRFTSGFEHEILEIRLAFLTSLYRVLRYSRFLVKVISINFQGDIKETYNLNVPQPSLFDENF